MAGAGARLFPENSKLTSAQVNTYLMDQTIMRFATTTARDAAFGGVGEPTLAEGMTCYIDADNSIYTYDGSNWVRMVSASRPPGMELVAKFTANGTSRSLDCDNVFTDAFQRYRIIGEMRSTINTNGFFFQLRDEAGTVLNTNYYSTAYGQDYAGAGTTFYPQGATTVAYVGYIPNSSYAMLSFSFDIFSTRNSNDATTWHGTQVGISTGAYYAGGQMMGTRTVSDRNRGLKFDNGGAGNLTGAVSIYGYRD